MDGWKRLAERIHAERVSRYRTREAFAHAAGVSVTTAKNLETARQRGYRPQTLYAVEAALGWQPGSAQRVLEGGEPIPDGDPHKHALDLAWPKLTVDERRRIAQWAGDTAASR